MNEEKTVRKIALVSGASKGIGRAICRELAAAEGAYVVVHYRSDPEGADETLALVEAAGGAGEVVQFDVRDPEGTRACVEELAARLGAIDILVNNAGIISDGLFVMMSEQSWHSVIDTSLNGFYNLTRPVLERMVPRRQGVVVSISSASASMANRGQANYAAAKAGLTAASRAVAAEVARLGIRVNVVAPGLIDTGMIVKAPREQIKALIPMARIGTPAEVAKVVRFLCSDDASYVTGQVVSVNGGMF